MFVPARPSALELCYDMTLHPIPPTLNPNPTPNEDRMHLVRHDGHAGADERPAVRHRLADHPLL